MAKAVARSRRRSRHPLSVWTDLALQTGEMLAASAHVISHRTQRIMRAGANPSARDRREFALMGTEKIEASIESAHAIATHLLTAGLQHAPRTPYQWWTAASRLGATAAALGAEGLKPIHARAVANSKRLRRR